MFGQLVEVNWWVVEEVHDERRTSSDQISCVNRLVHIYLHTRLSRQQPTLFWDGGRLLTSPAVREDQVRIFSCFREYAGNRQKKTHTKLEKF